jgi:hypothetical protein
MMYQAFQDLNSGGLSWLLVIFSQRRQRSSDAGFKDCLQFCELLTSAKQH